jgi:hypothetical protein
MVQSPDERYPVAAKSIARAAGHCKFGGKIFPAEANHSHAGLPRQFDCLYIGVADGFLPRHFA